MTSITLNTDCLKVLKNLPTNCYDVGIVDVPYGIDVTKMPFVKEKKHGGKQKNGKRLTVKRPKRNFSSDWDSSPPRQDYFNELCRVTKHQIIFGVEYVNWVGLGDGRIKWDKCKECSKVYKRQHYLKNKENYAAKKRSRQRNSSKHKSVSAVYHAIKAGKLVRQPCEECGAEKAEAHHDDYAKPLEVRWLCRSHHRQWHVEYGEALNAFTVRHWTPPKEATQ